MKKTGIFLSLMISASFVFSQNEVDVLRYSILDPGGTARFTATGGAFGALGGDFTTLSFNPAGIAMYKSSEFSFSPGLYIGKTTSDYLGVNSDDQRYNFNLGNLGMVFAYSKPVRTEQDKYGWRAFQFGFGLNRLANYNNRMLIFGNNPNNSLLDTYVSYANGYYPEDLDLFSTYLAYETWLIDPVGNTNMYTNKSPDGVISQRKTVSTEGSMNEVVFSAGANYSDRLYFGATIGIPYLYYYEESTYEEFNEGMADSTTYRSFALHNNLETRGTGFNLKLGMIFRATDWVRLGVAFHTPSFFTKMSDEYSSSMESVIGDGNAYSFSSPLGEFDYQIETPMRAIGSIAFVIEKYGLISAEYEFVDYAKARIRFDNPFKSEEINVNDAIKNSYSSVGIIRLGTEWRYDRFSFRGGYGLYGSPFKSGINDGERTTYAFGIGYRDKKYFVDLGYQYMKYQEDYYLYNSADVVSQPVNNELTGSKFVFTWGVRF